MVGDVFIRIFAWFLYFWMTVIHDFVKFVNHFEEYLDNQLLKTKPYLSIFARLCILSTFIEDAVRMWIHFGAERKYREEEWNCGSHLATLFILYTILGQLIPAIMLISRKYVPASCGTLASILVLQNIIHYIPWSWAFLVPNFAVGCSLWILFAVTQYEQRSMNIRADDRLEKIENRIQFLERLIPYINCLECLYCFVTCYYYIVISYYYIVTGNYNFMTLPIYFVFCLITSTLQYLRNFGYKLRIWRVAFALWLFGINFWFNSSWNISNDDFMKFSFFQNTSLIGGLFLLIAYETGGICTEDLLRRE